MFLLMFVCPHGGITACTWAGGVDWGRGVCGQRGMWTVYSPRLTATEAVSAHPTGMHSCLKEKFHW